MRGTSLRQFLQSFCFKSPWNYAFFWRLQHECPMVLTWEDGYLDIACASETNKSVNGNCYNKSLNELLSSNCGPGSHNGYSGDHPICLAMAEMSSTHHVGGKGVVGEVASLCIPRWIYVDSIALANLSFASVAECPDEWLLQFVSGIKTILLVPCMPHGVLQLGSLETVAENMEMITILAGKFDACFNSVDYFSGGESREFILQSTLSENLDVPSVTTTNKFNEDDTAADIPIQEDHKLSTAFPITSLFEIQDAVQLFGENMPNAPHKADERKISMQRGDTIDLVKQLNQQYSDNRSGIIENSFSRSSCLAKDDDGFSYYNCNGDGLGVFNEVDLYFDGDTLDQQTLGMDYSDIMLRNLSNSFSCPTESELYNALGGTIHNKLSDFRENTACKSINADDRMSNIEPSIAESNGWCLEEYDAENLLESVVAGACIISDVCSLYELTGLESLSVPSGESVLSCKRLKQSTGMAGGSAVTGSNLTSASAGLDKYSLADSSHSASSFDGVVGAFNEGQHQNRFSSPLIRRKESKVSNTNRKRGRSGDSHRPRPWDRQLIQDRLKELRQLVPSGAKCSIDGLLDKTIKHMLFLRTVTDQADKLRRQDQIEVSPSKSPQSPGVKTSYQQGTCWAVELGNEDQICPIIVKDLELPGQMQIEMACEDHGRFLEIADVIHRLELTILKGLMEKRSDITWAHFIVETSGGCHRLDIFWPLMQLLQQVLSSVPRKM